MLIINDLFKQHKKLKKFAIIIIYYYIYTAIKNYKHKLKVL